ncbi:protein Mis18-alpha [Ambystoma mexicanum]|uniref:protein Mis18-alpha n=1 Tax=Ambystoma mexicanum TaxID=8296 RepID=UPI0037E716F9
MAGLNNTAGDSARLVLICNGDETKLALETNVQTEAVSEKSCRDSPEPPPLVFLCSQCKRVLGDSTGWMESDVEDQTVMLKVVSPYVTVDKEPRVSTCPQDDCCMIESLMCSGCCACIGKMYKSTPKHLDYKRELYCLDVDAVESYVLGSTTVQEISDKDEPITLEKRSEVEEELERAKTVLKLLQSQISTLQAKIS